MLPVQTLEIIASWAQDASKEDSRKYFFNIPELSKIRSGRGYFVIGRKGTGKTAVGEYLLSLEGNPKNETQAERLSFRNFPFSDLYRLREGAHGAAPTASEYVSAWRFLIYCAVCKMLARNRYLNSAIRTRLAAAFPTNEIDALSDHVSNWTGGSFSIAQIVGGSASRQISENLASLNERADALERFIVENVDRGAFFIVLDSLDDDYRYEGQLAPGQTRSASKDYFILLAGLFKAVEEISTRLPLNKRAFNIIPVVLLRDDIFKFVKDNDRRKWRDSTLILNWDENQIKSMLAHRLCRAADIELRVFAEAWALLVNDDAFNHFGTRTSKFEFITKYTLRRPRDYIYYIREAAELAANRARNQHRTDAYLGGQVLRDSAGLFATHLREEIEDELGGQIEDPSALMDCVLDLGKTLFREGEFGALFNQRGLNNKLGIDHLEALHRLFELSAIGFIPQRKPTFRYLDPDLKLNPSKTIVLHTGLVRAQQVG